MDENGGVKKLRRADIELIAQDAILSETQTNERSVLLVTTLSLGCRIWLELGWRLELAAPTSQRTSAKFAAELFEEMARSAPELTGFPEVKGIAEAFRGLSMVCHQISDEAHFDLVGTEALFAGILLGRLGVLDIGDRQLNEAFVALAKAEQAAVTRQKSLLINRNERELDLLDFAKPLVAADPTLTNLELQKRFRALPTQKPKEQRTNSNNEAKILAAFRKDGRLPPRKRKSP